MSQCIEGEAAGEDSEHVGLQRTDSFWWGRGSDYNLEVEWRKKRPLEMKRSRKLRSQGAGMGINLVNLTEVDKKELCGEEGGEAGTVALSEQGHVTSW